AVNINPKKRGLEQGAPCNNDDQCDTQICRHADQDPYKCQKTDTRDDGDNCLVDAA
ncbi:12539_t:CDS:1, partial [Dentiscutata erythropus]